MPYTVQFVGVVCFLRQNGSRLAMLADGRQFTPRHTARIVVEPSSVISEVGWNRTEAQIRRGQFILPQGSVNLEGADKVGTLDSTLQESRLPRLQVLEPTFRINPAQARTVATLPIRQGKLEAFRYPASPDTPTVSLISQLDVPHNGTITVTVTPTTGAVRNIVLKAGTEIAVVNDSMALGRGQNHFHIYDQLNTATTRITVGKIPPPVLMRNLPVSQSRHRVFNELVDGNDSCPNTGCCP